MAADKFKIKYCADKPNIIPKMPNLMSGKYAPEIGNAEDDFAEPEFGRGKPAAGGLTLPP